MFHRITDFQMVTLLEIAEGMLLGSPEYDGMQKLQLYVPRSLLSRHISFPKHVVLYASANNPGAAAAAEEMRARFPEDISITTGAEGGKGLSNSRMATHFLLYLSQQVHCTPLCDPLRAPPTTTCSLERLQRRVPTRPYPNSAD